MAAPRLPFLWPFLYRSQAFMARGTRAHASKQRGLSTSTRRHQISTQRYGTANEPPPPEMASPPSLGSVSESKHPKKPSQPETKQKKSRSRKEKDKDKDRGAEAAAEAKESPVGPQDLASAAPAVLSVEQKAQAPTPPSTAAPSQAVPQSQASKTPSLHGPDSLPPTPSPPPLRPPPGNALQTVLNLPSDSTTKTATISPSTYYHENASADPSEHRPPHLSTPPFVHHFDTYSLVRRLTEGGWSGPQAVTAMKAVRLILADNIDLARSGLVSRSNVENEAYLFRAACSELRTEVGMRRKAETEKSRGQRTQLQHEVDILGQRVGMETAALKEELKGMVEGRRMAVREEGRAAEGKIQELNYGITVKLNSDSRSDVEGVRWLITKRAIAALAICVAMVLGSLRYASSVQQEEEARRKRLERMVASGTQTEAGGGGIGGRVGRENVMGDAAAAAGTEQREREREGRGEMLVQEGDNPSFVSLG